MPNRGNMLFLIKWCWENWVTTCRRMKLDSCYTTHKKLIENLSIRPETIKLLQKKKNRKNLVDISPGNNFLDMAPGKQATKAKTNENESH